MKCPQCDNTGSKVVETRYNENDNVNRRRRECEDCGERFTTYEKIESPPIKVVKSDGREEDFSEEKLRNGIEKACKKRPIGQDRIEEIVKEVKLHIRSRGEGRIDSSEIGDLVVERLKELDEVAYLRFTSIYNSFDDVSAFEEEVETLKTDS